MINQSNVKKDEDTMEEEEKIITTQMTSTGRLWRKRR